MTRVLLAALVLLYLSASPAAALCLEEARPETWTRFVDRHRVVAVVEVVRVTPRERVSADLSSYGKGSMRVRTLRVLKGPYDRPFTYVRYEYSLSDDLTGWGVNPSVGDRHLLLIGPDGKPSVYDFGRLCVYGSPPELEALLHPWLPQSGGMS